MNHQCQAQKREKMFRLLRAYVEREGDAFVSPSHKEDGESLGKWLRTQKDKYVAGRLQEERAIRLESLGVRWYGQSTSTYHDLTWNKKLALLLMYKEREGNKRVPCKHKENGVSLEPWMSKQRRVFKAGKLKAERLKKLESVGELWGFYC